MFVIRSDPLVDASRCGFVRAVAQGQSLKTVADLLGHRSLDATRIYANVDLAQLRSVGLSWPEEVQA